MSAVHFPDARKSPTAVLLLLWSHLREILSSFPRDISVVIGALSLPLGFLQECGVAVNRADPIVSITSHIPVSLLAGLLLHNPSGTSQKLQPLPVLNKNFLPGSLSFCVVYSTQIHLSAAAS